MMKINELENEINKIDREIEKLDNKHDEIIMRSLDIDIDNYTNKKLIKLAKLVSVHRDILIQERAKLVNRKYNLV